MVAPAALITTSVVTENCRRPPASHARGAHTSDRGTAASPERHTPEVAHEGEDKVHTQRQSRANAQL